MILETRFAISVPQCRLSKMCKELVSERGTGICKLENVNWVDVQAMMTSFPLSNMQFFSVGMHLKPVQPVFSRAFTVYQRLTFSDCLVS